MTQSREELIYMTKVCEQTERFEDMKQNIKDIVSSFPETVYFIYFRNFPSKRETYYPSLTRTPSVLEEPPGEPSTPSNKKKPPNPPNTST